jgi:N12 class adenine-specific DNA methylase
VFRDPATGTWETADAYLSGVVRTKLRRAATAAAEDPAFARRFEPLCEVQPRDLPPSDISARLGSHDLSLSSDYPRQ